MIGRTIDMYITPGRGAVPVDELTREEAIAALRDAWAHVDSARHSTRQAFDLLRLRNARKA